MSTLIKYINNKRFMTHKYAHIYIYIYIYIMNFNKIYFSFITTETTYIV